MKQTAEHQAPPKRPVNLLLTDENVKKARCYTANLSSTMDSLLAGYVASKEREDLAKQLGRDQVCEALNQFNAEHGSFAEEHSTL